MTIAHFAVYRNMSVSVCFLQKKSKDASENAIIVKENDKQEEMKESKAVYVTRNTIREDQNIVYQFYRSERDTAGQRHENRSHFSCQYDSKKDNEICTCKNVITLQKQQYIKYFSGMPKQIYTYHGSRSFTDVGVGSVKSIPRRKVRRVYLPETDEIGVGSSELSTYMFRRSRYPKIVAVKGSYYDHKKTSSKCVGGILEYNTGCAINEKLSPIVHTKSGATSPNASFESKNNEIGSNTVEKKFETIGTQFETENKEEKHEIYVKTVEISAVRIKPVKKISDNTQKSKIFNDGVVDSKKQELEKKAKDADKTYSSDSLVQHVHNLESPSDEKHSRTSFQDPMENKLEREYRKMFSTTKSKDSKSSYEKPIPTYKSASMLKRRFEALRRGLVKKNDSNYKKNDSAMLKTSTRESFPSHKDVSITSDPPSLIARSISNSKKYSPGTRNVEQDRYKSQPSTNEKYGREWPNTPTESDSQGVKGMFKLWGKKFNFEDESNQKNQTSPMPSYDTGKKSEKDVKTVTGEPITKKEGRKFFFFKKKSKDKNKDTYMPKKDVMAGRCEISDGLTLKLGGTTTPKEKISRISEEGEEITRKAWLRKFLTNTIESARSVNVRWNNSMYATSSSTVFELLDTVYKNNAVILRSRSEITTEDSSLYKSYTKHKVNFVQDIEAWMIPKTIPDRLTKQIPVKINSNKEVKERTIEVTISDQKWYIDKSEAFSHKIELVLHSKNLCKPNNDKVSSEYLRIDIPNDFFDASSEESGRNQSSDEEVFKIVEYETNSEFRRGKTAIKGLEKGDQAPNDIKVIVSVQTSGNKESQIIEKVIKQPPRRRDVVIQGSNVNIPKRCDVIGVGIITQRDLREMTNPSLKIEDDLTDDDESDEAIQPIQNKCEFAESYLQEYYRQWTPLGLDVCSWCASGSNLKLCSENSITSLNNQEHGSKSCPNIYDDFQTAYMSCDTSSCSRCAYEDQCDVKDCFSAKLFKRLKKNPSKSKTDTELEKRVMPKDSLEVFKRRKIYAQSLKSQWADTCTGPAEKFIPVSSVESRGPQNTTTVSCPRDKSILRGRKKTCKKHVSLPDCETMNSILNKQLADTKPEGILNFKGAAGCEACKTRGSKCSKHAVVCPQPSCEIPQPPCKTSCETLKNPPCSRPYSPSCNVTPRSASCVSGGTPVCPKPPLPLDCDQNFSACSTPQSPCRQSPCPAALPPCAKSPKKCHSPPAERSCSPSSVSSGFIIFEPCTENPHQPCKKHRSPANCSKHSIRKRSRAPSRCSPPPLCPKPSPPPCNKKPPSCVKSPYPSSPGCKKELRPPCKKPSICAKPSPPPCTKPSTPPCTKPPPCTSPPPPCTKPSPPCTKPPSQPCSKRQPPLCTKPPLQSCTNPPIPPCMKPLPPPCKKPTPCKTISPPPCPCGTPLTPPCKIPPPCNTPPPVTRCSLPRPCPIKYPPPCPGKTCPSTPPPCKKSRSRPPCKKVLKSAPCTTNPAECCHDYSSCSISCKSKPVTRTASQCSVVPASGDGGMKCSSQSSLLTYSPCVSPKTSHSLIPPCAPKPPACPPKSPPCPPKSPPCPPKSPPCQPKSPPCPPKSPPCQPKSPACAPKAPPCAPNPPPCAPKAPQCPPKPPPCPNKPPTPPKNFQAGPGSKTGLLLNKCPSPKKPPKKSPCNLSPCDQYRKPKECAMSPRESKSQCNESPSEEEFPWPMNNQNSCPPSPKRRDSSTCLAKQREKSPDKCKKSCSMKRLPPEENRMPDCPSKRRIRRKRSNQSCIEDICYHEPERCQLPDYNRESKCPNKPIYPPCPIGTNSKVSGIYLKMRPSRKKTCAEDCTAWDLSEELQGVVKLSSHEKISIRLKHKSPSTEEIRDCGESRNIKVQDEDGSTLYERKDYNCTQQRYSVLGDMYRDSKINRVSTPIISDLAENNEKELSAIKSDRSLANSIEIQFKLRITQGDKTTEINIANENEQNNELKSHIAKATPEVFVVKSGTERVNEDVDPKNDINIKIIVRNYKPKNRDIEGNQRNDEFTKNISEKFHTVSTGYSDVTVEPDAPKRVVSIHRTTIDLCSSVEGSKTQLNACNELPCNEFTENEPNYLFLSHSTEQVATDATEDEYNEISSKKDSHSEKIEETNTNESELPDFNDTDDQDATLHDVCDVESVMSNHTSKELKKGLLKKIFHKAGKTQGKDKKTVRQLRDMLKIILTDSSDNDARNGSSIELQKDVTFAPIQSNYFRDTDSMNNYYQLESTLSSLRNTKIATIYPSDEHHSVSSKCSDTDNSDRSAKGCICSKIAKKLNQSKMNISCCCRQKIRKDEETNCDMRNADDLFLLNYRTEYVDVETQHSKYLSSKVNSLNVSIHSKNTSFIKTTKEAKVIEEFEITHRPNEKKRDTVIISSHKSRIKEGEVNVLNLNTVFGFPENDKLPAFNDEIPVKEVSEAVDGEKKRKKSKHYKREKEADILQSFEAKKAVLEIYAEKARDGGHFVAKLPKFVYERESEITRNYEQIATNSYKSVCKENIVLMSIQR